MKRALLKTLKIITTAIPIIVGVLMFVNLINPLLQDHYSNIFTGNYILEPFVGALLRSVSFGIPIISYVTGGELLKEGVSLLAVTAFILAWSTVGIIMLPLESSCLGKKFALLRNLLNFNSAILISILTIFTLKFF